MAKRKCENTSYKMVRLSELNIVESKDALKAIPEGKVLINIDKPMIKRRILIWE